MSRVARRRALALATTASLAIGLTATTAAADPAERTVALVGSLQDEVGCATDWDPACTASALAPQGDGTYAARFEIPEGAYELKVAVNGSWDENYGAGGAAGGANIPLAVAGPATLEFRYDDATHLITVAPTDLPSDRVRRADRQLAADSLRTPLTREQFYFVMTDRFANGDPGNDTGGLTGDRLTTGLDPTNWGFFHGGDLRGLLDNLDYIQGLGTTALWLTPSFANKPVQGEGVNASAGYHGYWVTDFTRIDPHLGTNEEMKELVDAAHARGMKVFFDIITNHTADVISYAEGQFSYISKDTEPYGDAAGNPFDDVDFVNSPDFPALDPAVSFPYTPVVAPEEATAKTPEWLNDTTLYHNRGDSTFSGESSTYGDFVGLDDLFTEHPRVQEGMQEIYEAWVDLGIDGFRIDTVKHVNLGFWQEFSPALLELAAAAGNDDFFMFGEVFDSSPAYMSTYTTAGRLPATLDFGFQSAAVAVANGSATTPLAELFAGDDYYTDADSNAYSAPTFLGNHDMGRVGYFVGGDIAKAELAHELMYTLRGQPVVYYGDEQGFIGTGGDKAARQDMFASQVAEYNAEQVMGGTPGSADRYSTSAPLYRLVSRLGDLRAEHPALADGAQVARFSSDEAGVFAVSRIDRRTGREYLVVANNAATDETATFDTYTDNGRFRPVYGGGSAVRADQQGAVTVPVPAMSVRVLRADRGMSSAAGDPTMAFASPGLGGVLAGRAEVRVVAPDDEHAQASFAYRLVGDSAWTPLGTDDNAPYRVFHDVSGLARGTLVEYRAVVEDSSGKMSARSSYGVVGDPPPAPAGPGVGDVEQPSAVSVPGSLNAAMGCGGDWDPACAAAQLTLDPNDEIWKGTFTLPEGSYAYKAAINGSWDENYGAGGVGNGGNIDLTVPPGGASVTFFYDHRTHWVTSSLQDPVVVAVGSFQSEMGCAADWDPACLRSWLQDPDGDGVYALATVQVPPGSYEAKVALERSWDENYGAGGVLNGPNLPFAVDTEGSVTSFSWDSESKVPSVGVASPPATPDLSVADGRWLDRRTVAYPTARLAAGLDPSWLRFRLHWGDGLAVDTTSLGGESVRLEVVGGAPDGYVALRIPSWAASGRARFPNAAIGVYSDADVLLDATSVQPRT